VSVDKVIAVPDVGDAEQVEVVEILVRPGDRVEKDQSLLVLESDKASVEIPSPLSGVIKQCFIDVGAIVEEGDQLLELSVSSEDETELAAVADNLGADESVTDKSTTESAGAPLHDDPGTVQTVDTTAGHQIVALCMPDMGEVESAEVTEIVCAVGQTIAAEQVLLVVETDKASVEIPSPCAGVIVRILTTEQQSVVSDELLIEIRAQIGNDSQPDREKTASQEAQPKRLEGAVTKVPVAAGQKKGRKRPQAQPLYSQTKPSNAVLVHAGPAVRKLAREFGVNLQQVGGSGKRGRIVKEDVQLFVKTSFSAARSQGQAPENRPLPNFSKFGSVKKVALPRIRQVSARNLQRNWQTIPHVTHFDEADITELEDFRKLSNKEQSPDKTKLTLLAFLIKACTAALQTYPRFNSSIEPDYQHWIEKEFYNIGIAVETDAGLMVPNIKNAEQKSLFAVAEEAALLASQARQHKLSPLDMQGSTFTISSLGGIGGTGFTPIVNGYEVAILGVARAQLKPVYTGESLNPRLILPLALSYDHRAIDGAEAARFLAHLGGLLGDAPGLMS
jgi:pyruvate dehydrogenase E2 component (dihydrolipoamide acetyltransferase)